MGSHRMTWGDVFATICSASSVTSSVQHASLARLGDDVHRRAEETGEGVIDASEAATSYVEPAMAALALRSARLDCCI